MDGLDSVLDYAEQQSTLLQRESERLVALRRELAALLTIEPDDYKNDYNNDVINSNQPVAHSPIPRRQLFVTSVSIHVYVMAVA